MAAAAGPVRPVPVVVPGAAPGRAGTFARRCPGRGAAARPDEPVTDPSQERTKRRAVLGGPINQYQRAA